MCIKTIYSRFHNENFSKNIRWFTEIAQAGRPRDPDMPVISAAINFSNSSSMHQPCWSCQIFMGTFTLFKRVISMVLKIIKILHHSLHVYTLYEWMLALDAWLRNCFETWFWNCSESIQKELYARGRNASISSFIKTNAFESLFFRAKTLHHTFQPFIERRNYKFILNP